MMRPLGVEAHASGGRNLNQPNSVRPEELLMAVQLPTPSQLRDIAGEVGLDLTDADVTSFIELMRPSVSAYNVVDAMPDVLPAVRYLRTPGYRPVGEENSHNAWYVKTTVQGAPAGKLAGKTVALKENIMLAGVPMMNGSATLEGYIPTSTRRWSSVFSTPGHDRWTKGNPAAQNPGGGAGGYQPAHRRLQCASTFESAPYKVCELLL